MSLANQLIRLVRDAAGDFGKRPLTDRIGLSDNILRNVFHENWNPRLKTLELLERSAAELRAEHLSKARHTQANPEIKVTGRRSRRRAGAR